MVKIESKELDRYYDVDIIEKNSDLSELLSVISISIKYVMDKHNMTYNDVVNQVERFVKTTKLGVVNGGNERSK